MVPRRLAAFEGMACRDLKLGDDTAGKHCTFILRSAFTLVQLSSSPLDGMPPDF
jgi:hypothetical protein